VIEAGSAPGFANLAVFATGSTSTLAQVTNVPAGIYYARIRAIVDGALTAVSNEIIVAVGGACLATVSPTSTHVPRSGGTFNVAVTSACAWAASSNSPFLTVLAGASGTGNGVVVVAVAPNPSSTRSGSLTIAGQLVTITQDASGLHVGFDLFDPSTQQSATTECRINAKPSRCVLRSTSFTFGPNAIVSYEWTVQYTYGGEIKTLTQTTTTPEFAFTDVCGLASSDASGALQPLSASLAVTDNLGDRAMAVSGTYAQPALNLRLYTCP
jgi:hypothetical protein